MISGRLERAAAEIAEGAAAAKRLEHRARRMVLVGDVRTPAAAAGRALDLLRTLADVVPLDVLARSAIEIERAVSIEYPREADGPPIVAEGCAATWRADEITAIIRPAPRAGDRRANYFTYEVRIGDRGRFEQETRLGGAGVSAVEALANAAEALECELARVGEAHGCQGCREGNRRRAGEPGAAAVGMRGCPGCEAYCARRRL